MMNTAQNVESDKGFYNRQNRTIHKARAQLCMELDDCRELAREIGGKASISSLTLRQRWELIEILKAKGAKVKNPPLSSVPVSPQGNPQNPPDTGACSVEAQERPGEVYPARLAYWNKRFPRRRPGFASNEQLAWIQANWELDFDDGRKGHGLRGFIWRQTRNLPQGPISDLTFLRDHQASAVITPLRKKAKKRQDLKAMGNKAT